MTGLHRVFIAEDEPPARERLRAALGRVAPQLQVVGESDSVRGTQDWLARHGPPDLLLLDIQLADGLSLELFEAGAPEVPVVFTTAYDRFALEAFKALAVDYLLKPVSDAALAQALAKAARLRRGFGAEVKAWRTRLLGRQGAAYVAVPVERLAYAVALDKLAVAVDEQGRRTTLDMSLAELEAQLDPARFFRLNRQLIVGAHAVERFSAIGKGRLRVELRPALAGDALVSQERAAAFRAWLDG